MNANKQRTSKRRDLKSVAQITSHRGLKLVQTVGLAAYELVGDGKQLMYGIAAAIAKQFRCLREAIAVRRSMSSSRGMNTIGESMEHRPKCSVATQKLPTDESLDWDQLSFDSQEHSNITFDDVVGLDDVKREILMRTVQPLRHRALRQVYGLPASSQTGILLYGPPGCGKTLLARAVAGELDAPIFHVRASDLISNWVGQAERNVAELFKKLRSVSRAVLFIDEVDALMPARRRNRSTIMQRVISEFLSQLDGFEHKSSDGRNEEGFLLIIGATNWPEAIDEAILRPGRLGVRAYVGLPCAASRKRLFERCLADRPIAANVSPRELAERSEGFTAADIEAACQAAVLQTFMRAAEGDGQQLAVEREELLGTLSRTICSVSESDALRYESYAPDILGRNTTLHKLPSSGI